MDIINNVYNLAQVLKYIPLFWMFFVFPFCLLFCAKGQTFEHFDVQSSEYTIALTIKSQKSLLGIGGIWEDNDGYILQLVKQKISNLSDSLKQKILQRRIIVSFYFDKEGKILKVVIYISKKGDFMLPERDFLEIYYLFRDLKLDMTKIAIDKNFEWGHFVCSMSKLLEREYKSNNAK